MPTITATAVSAATALTTPALSARTAIAIARSTLGTAMALIAITASVTTTRHRLLFIERHHATAIGITAVIELRPLAIGTAAILDDIASGSVIRGDVSHLYRNTNPVLDVEPIPWRAVETPQRKGQVQRRMHVPPEGRVGRKGQMHLIERTSKMPL
jgi:hypothetical protein